MSLDHSTTYCWFESGTRLGPVYIGFEISEAEQHNLAGPHCVFQQAALVSNSELFVQAIELWQKIDLDLMPCNEPVETGIQLNLTLKSDATENTSGESGNTIDNIQHESPRKVAAIFPVSSFTELAPLNDELDAVLSIDSSAVLLQVKLDDFEISAEEFGLLESGAVVLLPKSYESEWFIDIDSITPDLPFNMPGTVVWKSTSTEVLFSLKNSQTSQTEVPIKSDAGSELEDNDRSCHRVSVYCQNPCKVPINQLLGSSENIKIPLDTSQLTLTSENCVVAHGALLSYGRGGVLAVNQIVTSG